uniref:WW domain-containing protein n=1 Tax=Lotharella globosa TaxID=91324 RepID=A0A6V3MTE6_9EUKA
MGSVHPRAITISAVVGGAAAVVWITWARGRDPETKTRGGNVDRAPSNEVDERLMSVVSKYNALLTKDKRNKERLQGAEQEIERLRRKVDEATRISERVLKEAQESTESQGRRSNIVEDLTKSMTSVASEGSQDHTSTGLEVLPDIWIGYVDEKTGCMYYYNPGKGETSWTEPEGERNKILIHYDAVEAMQYASGQEAATQCKDQMQHLQQRSLDLLKAEQKRVSELQAELKKVRTESKQLQKLVILQRRHEAALEEALGKIQSPHPATPANRQSSDDSKKGESVGTLRRLLSLSPSHKPTEILMVSDLVKERFNFYLGSLVGFECNSLVDLKS